MSDYSRESAGVLHLPTYMRGLEEEAAMMTRDKRSVKQAKSANNCAVHIEHQHFESRRFLEIFRVLRYTDNHRFAVSDDASTSVFAPENDISCDGDARTQASARHTADAAISRPRLYRVHRASAVCANAPKTSVVIEHIALHRAFQSAVEPAGEDDDGDGDDGGSKPPSATRVPDTHPAARRDAGMPTGAWRLWPSFGTAAPDAHGVYVYVAAAEDTAAAPAAVWLIAPHATQLAQAPRGGAALTAAVSSLAVEKTADYLENASTGGALGVPNASAPKRVASWTGLDAGGVDLDDDVCDTDIERSVGAEWARELAMQCGLGKCEYYDSSDVVVNKFWILLGVKTGMLPNPLTVSEQKLCEWETSREEEEADATDDSSPSSLKISREDTEKFRDKASYFSTRKQTGTECRLLVLYRATELGVLHKLEYKECCRDTVTKANLFNDGVYFLDVGYHVFVWVGSKCEEWKKLNSIFLGQVSSHQYFNTSHEHSIKAFVIKQNKNEKVPVTGLVEMGENEEFCALFE
ncbi:hypothetical protein HDU82_001364 [Entophlyctis luteolus]|nr:hypothetical protein HDU82_001364 [Entophlyctis luteolus]